MLASMSIRHAMLKLRTDALERGMREAATVYGWSALRCGDDQLERGLAEIVRGLKRTEGNNRNFSQ